MTSGTPVITLVMTGLRRFVGCPTHYWRIGLRRPICRLLLEWRLLSPSKLRNPETRAGEVMMALLGCFALLLSVIAVVGS